MAQGSRLRVIKALSLGWGIVAMSSIIGCLDKKPVSPPPLSKATTAGKTVAPPPNGGFSSTTTAPNPSSGMGTNSPFNPVSSNPAPAPYQPTTNVPLPNANPSNYGGISPPARTGIMNQSSLPQPSNLQPISATNTQMTAQPPAPPSNWDGNRSSNYRQPDPNVQLTSLGPVPPSTPLPTAPQMPNSTDAYATTFPSAQLAPPMAPGIRQ